MRKLILGVALAALVALPATVMCRTAQRAVSQAGIASSESAGKVIRSSLGRGFASTTLTVREATPRPGVLGSDDGDKSGPVEGAFTLLPCYPNPFNPTTTVAYRLSEATRVDLLVYDVSGRLVRTLAQGRGEADVTYQVVWDGTNDAGHSLPSGVYLLRMLTETSAQTGKLVLLK